MKSFKFKIDGHGYQVSVNEIEGNLAEVVVNGTTFQVEIEKEEKVSQVAPRTQRTQSAPSTPSAQSTGTQAVKSPLPGSIVKVAVKAGDKVSVGQELLTMESMKMENSIKSEFAGTVKTVLVAAGQNVMQDDKLIEIETEAAAAPAPKAEAKPAPAPKVEAKPAPAPAPKPAAPADGVKVLSPLPGSVVRVVVADGQAVKKGDTLLVLESMKMENEVKAEQGGTVKKVMVAAGQNVMQDDVLIVLG